MKTLKKIFLWIVIVLAVLIIIAFLLPKSYHVESNTLMANNKSLIYNLTSNLNKWDLWTSWKQKDTGAVYELIGPDGHVGTTRKWEGKTIGNGQMTLTQLVPGELVGYDLSFQYGKYQSKGKITIETVGDSSKVSWIDEGDLGYNPLSRYMGLFMGRMLIPDFNKGLAKLKRVVNERKGWPRIEEHSLPEQNVILIRDSAGPATYSKVMDKGYTELMNFIKSEKIESSGCPFAIYLKYDTVTMFSVMDLGIPINKIVKGKGRIRMETIPAGNAVIAYYFGPYDKTASTYYALHKYCLEGKKTTIGGPWELYVTDPITEKDPMKIETDIVFRVK